MFDKDGEIIKDWQLERWYTNADITARMLAEAARRTENIAYRNYSEKAASAARIARGHIRAEMARREG